MMLISEHIQIINYNYEKTMNILLKNRKRSMNKQKIKKFKEIIEQMFTF